jgi:hypothetical protein
MEILDRTQREVSQKIQLTLITIARSFMIMAIMLAIWAVPSKATTLCSTVTSTADDGSSGTLRYAIAQANAGSCDTINFNLPAGSTITLQQGQLEISNTSTPITISGPGAANLAISGNNATRVFLIDAGVTVGISDVTVRNGVNANLGGGIYNAGTATVTNSTFSGNSASVGGGFLNSGTATVTNSTFSGNSTRGFPGGGIANYGGTLTVINSTFSGNSSGMWNGSQGNATVTDSTFSGNSGGGGFVNSATATVTNSTFSGNLVGFSTSTGSTATVTNSTFSGNSGGNIHNNDGGQPGAVITVKNTLLANSSSGNCANQVFGTFISDGYNLSDDASCSSFFTGTGDLNNTPAGLDPSGLKYNGGPTQTIAILPSSAAFNVIPLSPTNYCTDVAGNPVTTDQRGSSRPQVSACDIGAFEYSSDNDSGLAALSGGNSFAGNQSVSGTMTANGFVGNGSGLSGVVLSVGASGVLSSSGGQNPTISLTGIVPIANGGTGASSTGADFVFAGPTSGSGALSFRALVAGDIPSLAGTYVLLAPGSPQVGAVSLTSTNGNIPAASFSGGNGIGVGVYGFSPSGDAVFGATNDGAGVYGVANTATGIGGWFDNIASSGKILSLRNHFVEKVSVDVAGNVTTTGNVATMGSVTIGSGTAIAKHLSMTFSLSVPSLKPSTCTTSTFSFTGASDGDTTALGVPNVLMTGGTIIYSAWVSAANTVTIRSCDVNPNGPATTAVSGTVRVDIWKH